MFIQLIVFVSPITIVITFISIFLIGSNKNDFKLYYFIYGLIGLDERTPHNVELREQHADVVRQIKGLLADHLEGVQKDVNDKIQNLQVFLQTSAEEGKNRISKKYEQTRLSLRELNAPEVCLNGVLERLTVAEHKNKKIFLFCTNFTTAAGDALDIAYEAAKFGGELLRKADYVLNGFWYCFNTWNPFKVLKCVFTWLAYSLSGVWETFASLAECLSRVRSLVNDIKRQFEYCVRNSDDELQGNAVMAYRALQKCIPGNVQRLSAPIT